MRRCSSSPTAGSRISFPWKHDVYRDFPVWQVLLPHVAWGFGEFSREVRARRGATALAKVRGTLVVVAIHPTPRELDLQRVFWRELRILGARVYQRADFETAVDLLSEGVIPADLLISAIVPLEETGQAFAELESGRALKILVDVAGRS